MTFCVWVLWVWSCLAAIKYEQISSTIKMKHANSLKTDWSAKSSGSLASWFTAHADVAVFFFLWLSAAQCPQSKARCLSVDPARAILSYLIYTKCQQSTLKKWTHKAQHSLNNFMLCLLYNSTVNGWIESLLWRSGISQAYFVTPSTIVLSFSF